MAVVPGKRLTLLASGGVGEDTPMHRRYEVYRVSLESDNTRSGRTLVDLGLGKPLCSSPRVHMGRQPVP
jgi:hypothetical protein